MDANKVEWQDVMKRTTYPASVWHQFEIHNDAKQTDFLTKEWWRWATIVSLRFKFTYSVIWLAHILKIGLDRSQGPDQGSVGTKFPFCSFKVTAINKAWSMSKFTRSQLYSQRPRGVFSVFVWDRGQVCVGCIEEVKDGYLETNRVNAASTLSRFSLSIAARLMYPALYKGYRCLNRWFLFLCCHCLQWNAMPSEIQIDWVDYLQRLS